MTALRLAAARLPAAAFRAALVFAVASVPALVLGGVDGGDEAGLVAAAAASLFVLFEYGARTPTLIDFRFAPPVNRMRFGMATGTLAAVLLFVASAGDGGALGGLHRAGLALGEAADGWASPAGMAGNILARPSALGPDPVIRGAAAVALLFAFGLTAIYSATLLFGRWPGNPSEFRPEVNLPTFEVGSVEDRPARLRRLGRQAVVMGLAMPIALLALAGIAGRLIDPDAFSRPLPLTWAAALWAAAPASQLLRGAALYALARAYDATAEGKGK